MLSSVSIFFPCYNDSATIGKLVKDAFEILPTIAGDYEVIVVNDASTDNSREVLAGLENLYSSQQFMVVDHERNMDYGGALRSGFKHSTKDFVFYTDGDGQYDVKEIVKLTHCMTEGVDLVNGHKKKRSDTWYRAIIGILYREVVKAAFSLDVIDVDCDFRLFRRKILQNMELKTNSGAICVEMMKKVQTAGCRCVQVPINHYPRIYGESQCFRPVRIMKMIGSLLVLWWKLVLFPVSGK